MLVHDPAFGLPICVNALAQEFGMTFAVGYLYDLEENYGIYRNILIDTFTESNITKGVRRIVMFTGTAIYSNATPLVETRRSTVLSVTGKRSNYTVAVLSNNVLAIGDITFLTDPYLEIEDNRKFLENIVCWLLEVETEG